MVVFGLGVYTSMCDVWSYGVLMWEVFSHGDQPYNGLTNSQARAKVEAGESRSSTGPLVRGISAPHLTVPYCTELVGSTSG